MAYKAASEIIANIGPTAAIRTIIRPLFNFKASKRPPRGHIPQPQSRSD